MIIKETVMILLFLLFNEVLLQSFYVPRILLFFSHAVLHDARGVFIIVTFNLIVIFSISDGHFTSENWFGWLFNLLTVTAVAVNNFDLLFLFLENGNSRPADVLHRGCMREPSLLSAPTIIIFHV